MILAFVKTGNIQLWYKLYNSGAAMLNKFPLIVQQGTASEATLMSMLAARCKAIRRVQASNPEKSEAEILSNLVAYTSEQVSPKRYFQSYICPVSYRDQVENFTHISVFLVSFKF